MPPVDPQAPRQQKDLRSHISGFRDWLGKNDKPLDERYLLDYGEYLRRERHLKASSIESILASLRAWLRKILAADNTGPSGVLIDSELKLNVYYPLLQGLNLRATLPAEVKKKADASLSPTNKHIQELIQNLDIGTLSGVRDAAVISSLLLGVRPLELCALDAEDAGSISAQRSPVLRIPKKPGCTPREIPYAGFEGVGELNQLWMRTAHIETGPLFRGFYRGCSKVRPERFSPESIGRIFEKYPIQVDEQPYILSPLELRRFSARCLMQKGYSLEITRQRLGVTQAQTVLNYLGGELPPPLEKSGRFEFRLEIMRGYESVRNN